MAIAPPRAAALLLAGSLLAPTPASPPASAYSSPPRICGPHAAPAGAHGASGGAAARGARDRAQTLQVALAAGDELKMGNGTLRSFTRTDPAGAVTAVGVRFDEASLDALPATGTELVLPLGPEAAPFKEIAVNWNPQGHEPPGIYDVPHFDFHFYTIDERGRDAITTDEAGLARVSKAPPAGRVPAGYVATPGGVPRMGAHWVDPSAFPELHGGTFASSPIIGYFDGELTFYEPMVALSYLRSKPNLRSTLKEPPEVSVHGRYPTAYSVAFDPASREYTIALEGMRAR
jgi:hypothetical protein